MLAGHRERSGEPRRVTES